MKTDPTFLGTVSRVTGARVQVEVSSDLPSTSPIVDGRVYRIGQIGSFVRIPLGFLDVYGIVSSVGSVALDDEREAHPPPRAMRTLDVQLVGEMLADSEFLRGVSEYPTLDDEVHVIRRSDMARIYGSGRERSPITVGTHAASENLAAVLDLDRLVTRHCAILGSTGSGKSNTVAALLKSLANGDYPSANVVVIDPHGEYGSAFSGISRVIRIADTMHPLLLPYWALSFDELAWFLVDRRSAAESPQDTKLRDLIYGMRCDNAPHCKASGLGNSLEIDQITADSPIPFDLRELWYSLDREERKTWADNARTSEALESEGDPRQLQSARFRAAGAGSALPHRNQPMPPMAAYAHRILARLKDRRFDFLLAPGDYNGKTRDLDSLVASWIDHNKSITVLDLAGIPSEVTDLVVGLVTRVLFETMFWGRDLQGVGRQRPLLLVYEEAHSYLPHAGGQFIQGYARRAVQRVLKEGRKYGVGALVVSQRPSELDETILSQCGTFVALRLTNSSDQGRVASMVPDEISGLISLLPMLRTGEAVILGDAITLPSRVRINHVSPRPDSGDPDVKGGWARNRDQAIDYGLAVTAWRNQQKTVGLSE